MPVAAWVVLVLLIDVAHVYSTLFRTYLDPVRNKKYSTLFYAVPILCYILGVLCYSVDALVFWRLLAYLAVFHFVRQQYGFMRLYSRTEHSSLFNRKLDAVAIYTATLYPILWWHLHPGRNFNWFIEEDFMFLSANRLTPIATGLYILVIAAYLIKEIRLAYQLRTFNVPKNAIVFGTFISWFVGIVLLNGDLVFTLLNVVSHGIPYMALVWVTSKKEQERQTNKVSRLFFGQYGVFCFIGCLFLLAWLEEGVWDGFVWREHQSVFLWFSRLPQMTSKYTLAFLVPLLSLPQSVHYVLDGFIWRKGR